MPQIDDTDSRYDCLRLENQLCFPLYAISKEIVRRYKPLLDRIDLTYTQYITMMVMWERRRISVREIGKLLFLDSGTLTPVLKKLEAKGFIVRERDRDDERVLDLSITDKGMELREQALDVPKQMMCTSIIEPEEAELLYGTLRKILGRLSGDE